MNSPSKSIRSYRVCHSKQGKGEDQMMKIERYNRFSLYNYHHTRKSFLWIPIRGQLTQCESFPARFFNPLQLDSCIERPDRPLRVSCSVSTSRAHLQIALTKAICQRDCAPRWVEKSSILSRWCIDHKTAKPPGSIPQTRIEIDRIREHDTWTVFSRSLQSTSSMKVRRLFGVDV